MKLALCGRATNLNITNREGILQGLILHRQREKTLGLVASGQLVENFKASKENLRQLRASWKGYENPHCNNTNPISGLTQRKFLKHYVLIFPNRHTSQLQRATL